jgi:phosphoribosylformylglycinamidine synthase
VTLAECCFGSGVGVDAAVDAVAVSRHAATSRAAALFGESASRVVVSTAASAERRVLELAEDAGVPARAFGRTIPSVLRIRVGGEDAIEIPVEQAERAWADAIERHVSRHAA